MWWKKLTVKTYTSYPEDLPKEFLEQITQEFFFYYTPCTKVKKLIDRACFVCKSGDEKDTKFLRFLVHSRSGLYQLQSNARLIKVLDWLKCDTHIELEYVVGIPGGAGIAEENGIKYFYHTKELRHTPHIHAKYQGDEISIEIEGLKVKGKFRNKKKQRIAVQYVSENKEKLLYMYNEYTNGIHIADFFEDD